MEIKEPKLSKNKNKKTVAHISLLRVGPKQSALAWRRPANQRSDIQHTDMCSSAYVSLSP